MKISRTFLIPTLDEAIKNKIITYWGNRNAQFKKITDNEFHAKRGSLLGNLTSLKMYKLKTTIFISIFENNQVTCVLNINTMFHHIKSTMCSLYPPERNSDNYSNYILVVVSTAYPNLIS